ncbi:MAG TPA: protein-glutamate O-methyltransferase CheR [Chromatiales bacterium]|nr:protein-glutamate O-methyltransferase CheR [Chromatiales bacterium]
MSDETPVTPTEYKAFQAFLEEACGIVLGDDQEYLIVSRLSGVIAEHGLGSLGGLLKAIKSGQNASLKTIVIDAMTTNETFWFRDMAHFRILTDTIFPQSGQLNRPLRIWSAACSAGQEPYSISMVAEEYRNVRPGRLPRDVDIVATDISARMVAEASTGVYCGMSVSRGLTRQQRSRFFTPQGECVRVNPEIRRRVTFRELNLTQEYTTLGKFDVIFCRNVLIYFSSELKKAILNKMAKALYPGGYLFLGSTESLSGLSDRFELVASHGGIVYRLKV